MTPQQQRRPPWRHLLAAVPPAFAGLYLGLNHPMTDAGDDSVIVIRAWVFTVLTLIIVGTFLSLLVMGIEGHRLAPASWLIALCGLTTPWLVNGSGWRVAAETAAADGTVFAVVGEYRTDTIELARQTSSGLFSRQFKLLPSFHSYMGANVPWESGEALVIANEELVGVLGNRELFHFRPPR